MVYMARLVNHPFPSRVADGTLAVTLNIPLGELAFLVADQHGRQFYARDEQALEGEDATANVARVYDALGVPAPKSFTSLGVRTPMDRSNVAATLACYGEIVLEIDIPAVSEDLLIVNGDFKDLGLKIASEVRDNVRWAQRLVHTQGCESLLKDITLMMTNARDGLHPRLVGSYFEARLLRPLVPTDVSAVYAPGAGQNALVRALCEG